MRKKSFHGFAVLPLVVLVFTAVVSASSSPGSSVFDIEQMKIRFNTASQPLYDSEVLSLSEEFATEKPPVYESGRGYKSPTKAFFLSLAVPGLGQYYYGSRVKPFVFLGAEVAAWVFYFNWHGEGDDITAEFQAFNKAHWSREDYEDKYLLWVFGVTSDTELPTGTRGITHHLPDDFTQQFYEMTGKYNQFSWGWDDAVLDGRDLDSYSMSDPPDTVLGAETVPFSANRLHYETRRNDANNAYDRATRMIFVSMANRLISAFEALFTTRSNNRKLRAYDGEFGRIKVRTSLKSYYAKSDTPFITVTCKF